MKWIYSILCGLVLAVASGGCSEPEDVVPEQTAEEIAAEQEAARRADETASLEKRAADLQSEVAELSGGGDLPESLDATLAQMQEARQGVDRLVADLAGASGESWESAKSRLEAALSDLQAARDDAARTIAAWRERESAAVAARESAGSPIDSASGLIIGLDGGDYPPYLTAAVERAQARLRELELYAGPVDGVLCKPTMEALGEFQTEHELQVSGVPSPMTRARLYHGG